MNPFAHANTIGALSHRRMVKDRIIQDLTDPENLCHKILRDAGFRVPVYVTETVWYAVMWPCRDTRDEQWMDEHDPMSTDRLRRVLDALRLASQTQRGLSDVILVRVELPDPVTRGPKTFTVKSVCSGEVGRNGRVCLTLMLEDEEFDTLEASHRERVKREGAKYKKRQAKRVKLAAQKQQPRQKATATSGVAHEPATVPVNRIANVGNFELAQLVQVTETNCVCNGARD